jgi:DNA-binding NarL/FixJ family response regulator
MAPRILLADDHEMVRAGLRAVLEAHPGWEVVAEAADGEKAISRALETRPDVAIIDYFLPLFNGAEVTRQIKSRIPNTEVLIFTLSDDDAVVGEALDAGARAFVLKNEGNDALIAAVLALASHRPSFSGKLSERLVQSYLTANRRASGDSLSARERSVVQLIAEGHTNQEIAKLLSLSVKTIESHRATAMAKIGAASTAEIVRYAIKHRLSEL